MAKTIIEVIQECGLDIKEEGTVLRTFCPFHDDKTKPNLTIYPKTDSYYCFACGESGDPAKFISQVEGISLETAIKKVQGQFVDMTELREMVDGLSVSDDELTYNTELNILVSRKVKGCLLRCPSGATELLVFLKEFDSELHQPIPYDQMQKILKKSEDILKKFV